MQRGQVVLVDTNIIIEAVRTGCWNALATHFSVQTVEKCCEEARTGEARRPGYVEVGEKVLREKLTVHRVSDAELAALSLRDAEAFRLDAGERYLWAHAAGRADAWIACCCDQAAINVAVRLDWGDRIVPGGISWRRGREASGEATQGAVHVQAPVRVAHGRTAQTRRQVSRFSVVESVRLLAPTEFWPPLPIEF